VLGDSLVAAHRRDVRPNRGPSWIIWGERDAQRPTARKESDELTTTTFSPHSVTPSHPPPRGLLIARRVSRSLSASPRLFLALCFFLARLVASPRKLVPCSRSCGSSLSAVAKRNTNLPPSLPHPISYPRQLDRSDLSPISTVSTIHRESSCPPSRGLGLVPRPCAIGSVAKSAPPAHTHPLATPAAE
jgi:hypothetical protein